MIPGATSNSPSDECLLNRREPDYSQVCQQNKCSRDSESHGCGTVLVPSSPPVSDNLPAQREERTTRFRCLLPKSYISVMASQNHRSALSRTRGQAPPITRRITSIIGKLDGTRSSTARCHGNKATIGKPISLTQKAPGDVILHCSELNSRE